MIKLNFTIDQVTSFINDCLNGKQTNGSPFKSLGYVGGTLSFVEKSTGVLLLLNLNGTFTYCSTSEEVLMMQNEDLIQTTRRCYLKTKGRTEYFKEEVQNYGIKILG